MTKLLVLRRVTSTATAIGYGHDCGYVVSTATYKLLLRSTVLRACSQSMHHVRITQLSIDILVDEHYVKTDKLMHGTVAHSLG